jgi:FtsP/CotA-like multicopper oxidase with cupredoxin domain
MRVLWWSVPAVMLTGLAGSLAAAAQDCPARPAVGSVVQNPYSISSQNGTLTAAFSMAKSVDTFGYTHYCYRYNAGGQVMEAPTLRVSPGDTLHLHIVNNIVDPDAMKMTMKPSSDPGKTCGDSGAETVDSTNVHFHGLNIAPTCHQDDVIHTLIQPGTPGFQYSIQIPKTEPPGLYWYHPHIHGFTEFQVNGGAAGAIVVEGMGRFRPEVKGLPERIFVIRQQYLVPWIPGAYQLTLNYIRAQSSGGDGDGVAPAIRGKLPHPELNPLPPPPPVIQMQAGQQEFWRVANASLQDFLQLQVIENNQPAPLQMIALDGYPLSKTRTETTILIPPAGRAEFIVQAPAAGGAATFMTQTYSTGPTGNPDVQAVLANIQAVSTVTQVQNPKPAVTSASEIKFSDLASQAATTQRKLYFSEEFGGTNGPIQFYITVDGQKPKVFNPDEKPVITTRVGQVEDWTIENRALETHAFHIHQIHFQVLEVNGKPVADSDLRDTIEIPYWTGTGPYPSVKVRMDFRDPTIAGTFLFHCHILLHEDLGMMHKILVEP